ncbi:MAG: phosphoribosylglycinamide formyltransferase [Gammaproteobacteria bacterium]|nr:phosphoribosylglycinamide formyltransferase [Gammaproteobacteria bacterium]
MSAAGATRLRVAVLVSGNGSNLQALLDQRDAAAPGYDIVGVVSDRPGVFALERATRAGIPAITVDYRACGGREAFARRLGEELDALQPALVVLAGFMRILPAELVNRYRGYTGLDTYRRALEAGDPWHGTTVHFVTPDLDAGPAILQYRLAVTRGDTEETLRERVQRGEHRIYPQVVHWIAAGRVGMEGGGVLLDGRALARPVIVDEDQLT